MFWLIVVVMVLVVGAAALVALGSGALPDAERDRLAAHLPANRPLRREDVDTLRFPMALRGYRMDEVDDVLDRLGAELMDRDIRVAELESALSAALAAGPTQAGQPGTEVFEALRMGFTAHDAPQPPQDALPGIEGAGLEGTDAP